MSEVDPGANKGELDLEILNGDYLQLGNQNNLSIIKYPEMIPYTELL